MNRANVEAFQAMVLACLFAVQPKAELFFGFGQKQGTKHPVPDRERDPKVLVNMLLCSGVMDMVLRWGHEDTLKRFPIANGNRTVTQI